MANTQKREPEFIVEKPVPNHSHLHFVRRVADGEQFLAAPFNRKRHPELTRLRTAAAGSGKPDEQTVVAFEAAARVLNHENLVSVWKAVRTARAGPSAERDAGEDYSLVHEWCADGDLRRVLDRPPRTVVEDGGFLPEGFVWHVALSVLRALVFLHEGWRERVVLAPGHDGMVVRQWYRLDAHWMPILHRAIRPENIHFQARKGRESYGLCKLGNFSRCVVAGTARDPLKDSCPEVVATLDDPDERDATPEDVRTLWRLAHQKERPDWKEVAKYGRMYTIGTELCSLGEILFHMMRGRGLVNQCQHGAFRDFEPAGCDCSSPAKDDIEFLQKSKYSAGLRELVVGLIRQNRENSARAYMHYEMAWAQYETWRQSADGWGHFDHYDDLVARKLAEKSRKLEYRKRELGDARLAERELAEQEQDEDLMTWE